MSAGEYINSLAAFVARLEREGSVPASAAGASVRKAIAPLLFSQVVLETRRGAGKTLEISKRDAWDRFVAKEFPAGLTWGSRDEVDATLRARNSKRGDADFVLVTMRGARGRLDFLDGGAIVLPNASRGSIGCASFFLSDDAPSASEIRTLVIVENLRVFARHEAICPEADAALFAAGKLPERVIDWLDSEAWAGVQFIHAGDYDPVGIREFERLYERLGASVRLLVPEGIEELFRHGNEKLLTAQQSGHLRAMLDHPDEGCRRVAALIMEQGRGLEQQALLQGEK